MKNSFFCYFFLILLLPIEIKAIGLDDRISSLEKQMMDVSGKNSSGTFGASLPSDVTGLRWFLGMDVLYWTARIGPGDFAYSNEGPTFLPLKGSSQQLSFSWSWGWRFSIGYHLPYDGWDLSSTYTQYQTSDSTSIEKPFPSTMSLLRGVSGTGYFVAAQYDVSLNDLNIEMGKSFFVSKQLSMRPSIGLRSSWIRQQQTVRLEQLTTDIFGSSRVEDKCRFIGVGPRMGANMKFYLDHGIFILGNLYTSLILGYFKADNSSNMSEAILGTPTDQDVSLKGRTHLFSPVLEGVLGLGWDNWVNDKKQRISISLSYEIQYFWRQNQMLSLSGSDIPNQKIYMGRYAEDISFSGLTGRFRVDF